MPEITREYIAEKRKGYENSLMLIQGALEMLDMIENDLFPQDAITLDELREIIGADSVEVLPVESEGKNGTS